MLGTSSFKELFIGAAFLALVFFAGVQTVRLGAEQAAHQRTRTAHAEVLQDLAEQTAAAYALVKQAFTAMRAEMETADRKHTQEMTHAKTENERLRVAARAGTVSVQFAAPHHGAGHAGDLPATPFASSLGHGAPAVDAELRERVFDHRSAVIQAEHQILYLQDYARTCAKGITP